MGVEFHWPFADNDDCLLCHRGTRARLGVGRDGDRRRGLVGPMDHRSTASEASPPP